MSKPKYVEPDDYLSPEMLKAFEEDDKQQKGEKETMIIGYEWENNIIREAIIEIGDKEALRLFDEEQEEMRKKAEAETEEMIKNGELIV